MDNPRLLILDEASEGLAPLVREEIWRGLAILIIDKNIKALIKIAGRHYIMEKGQLVWKGTTQELEAQPEILSRYMGV